jgi:hypothetical protein
VPGPEQAGTVNDEPAPAAGGLLTPLPETGIPPLVHLVPGQRAEDLARRAEIRQYAQQIRQIRHRYLGPNRSAQLRAEGLAQLKEFTDPAAMVPLVQELRGMDDEVQLAVLDHLAASGDAGQGALAWVAIADEDEAIRHEATTRLTTPAAPPVAALLDQGLRSADDTLATRAGTLTGALGVIEAIPLLIHAQVSTPPTGLDRGQGDLAWIAIQTQTAYVQRLEPVVGSGAGAFQPVPGIVTEGFVFRAVDAVVITYRTEIHYTLVAMTTQDWGQSTAHLGYDVTAWRNWYDTEYVPYKIEQAKLGALVGE